MIAIYVIFDISYVFLWNIVFLITNNFEKYGSFISFDSLETKDLFVKDIHQYHLQI